MLPKNRRIPTPLLLLAIKKSSTFSSEHLLLRVHQLNRENRDKSVKIAIITPAKINSRAVDRHLSKRKISACLEKDLKLIQSGQYLIWQVKKDITELKMADLAKEIKGLLNLPLSR